MDGQYGHDALEVSQLQKSYGKRLILRDISLHVHPGEVVALLGPNGSGKTTCFYCIAGIVKHEGGSVHLNGADATGLPLFRRARMGLGYLPQENEHLSRPERGAKTSCQCWKSGCVTKPRARMRWTIC